MVLLASLSLLVMSSGVCEALEYIDSFHVRKIPDSRWSEPVKSGSHQEENLKGLVVAMSEAAVVV